MPELDFRGKEFVRNHHLTVPYRPLVPDATKSIGAPDLNGNLIIQGDNLEALVSLMPMYGGKVDCIFIDPPYNTGNEGWAYNDNVNSDAIKAWFSQNPVGIEDGLRHDKWCAMMWPRLQLLWELLRDYGTLWVTINDIEVHRLRQLLDEIFGEDNFVANVCWQKKYATANDTVDFSDMHDFILVYTKGRPDTPNKRDRAVLNRVPRTVDQNLLYKNPDNDHRGLWMSGDYTCNKTAEERPNLYYPILNPFTGEEVWPKRTAVWRYTRERHEANVADNLVWWGEAGKNATPRLKRFLSSVSGTVASTWWTHQYAGHTDQAKKELQAIFSDGSANFATPKPVKLIRQILQLAVGDNPDAVILDSFAGSGTTAQAVLEMNEEDGGNRRFILVEMEEYADALTAERVRRITDKYRKPAEAVVLLEIPLTWSELKKGNSVAQRALDAQAAYAGNFDKVKIQIEDGWLRVEGENDLGDSVRGYISGFTYCTLGEPLELNRLLAGEGLPARQAVGDYLIYLAGGNPQLRETMPVPEELQDAYVGLVQGVHYWLLYRDDLTFLTSPAASLTLDLAKAIQRCDPHRPHRVYSPGKAVSNRLLRAEAPRIEAIPLPYALFRRHGGA